MEIIFVLMTSHIYKGYSYFLVFLICAACTWRKQDVSMKEYNLQNNCQHKMFLVNKFILDGYDLLVRH